MFTFSFGSAFAAAPNYSPKTENLEAATAYLNSALATAAAKEALGTTYSDEIEAYASKYIANQSTIILSGLEKYYDLDDTSDYSDFKTEVNRWIGITSGGTKYFGQKVYNVLTGGTYSTGEYYQYSNGWTAASLSDGDDLTGYYEKTGNGTELETFKATYAEYYNKIADDYGMTVLKDLAVAQLQAIDTTVYTERVSTYSYGFDSLDSDLGTYNGVEKEVSGQQYAADLIAEYIDVIKAIDTTNESYDTYTELKNKINTLLYGKNDGTVKDYESSGCLYGILDTITTKAGQETIDGNAKVDLAYSKSEVNYYLNKTVLRDGLAVEKGDDVTTGTGNIWENLLNASGITNGTTKIDGVMVYDSTNKIVCGVNVTNLTSLTAAEAAAVNAQLSAWVNDAVEVLDVYLDELEVTSTNKDTVYSTAVSTIKTKECPELFAAVYTAKDKYDDLAATATRMKAQYNLDGTKVYADADIDEALAKDKADIYSRVFNATGYKDYLSKVSQTADEVAAAIAAAQKKFGTVNGDKITSYAVISYTTPVTAEADKKYCEDFYATEVKGTGNDYQEIADDTVKALYDAKTVEEVNTIMAEADAKLAELRTAAQEAALKNTDVTKYDSALTNYVAEAKALMTITPTGTYRAASIVDVAKTYTSTMNQDDGTYGAFKYAKDTADLEKLYQEAKTKIAAIKTDKELTAMAEEVVKLINALPAAATLENEEAYMAAYKAMKDYLDQPGTTNGDISGYLVFQSKMATLKTAQEKAITDAINVIPSAITLDNKDKVETARATFDKYYDFYDQFDETITPNDNEIKTAEGKVRTAEINDVIQQISKLNDNSTDAEIAAARAAYDALTGSQQREVKAAAGTYKLYILEKFDVDDAKAYVQDLKIKARSVKTSKGVKVTINADVQTLLDKGFTVEYKFYRSTKSNKNFGTAKITKTENTYLNTSGTKGTKYYYKAKLVVKDSNGTVVATTPLSQCLYACRTF